MLKRHYLLLHFFISLWLYSWGALQPAHAEETIDPNSEAMVIEFLLPWAGNSDRTEKALRHIEKNWQETFAVMLLEVTNYTSDPVLATRLLSLLKSKTQQDFGYDTHQWFEWIWQQNLPNHPHYATFKSHLYGLIDQKFSGYFNTKYPSTINLNEVLWGGVQQDGIPPLRNPKMIKVEEANYLYDDHIVFGIAVNGDARAYPQRILAWHEMFVDEVGGESVVGVYCTLCGTVILYKSSLDGTHHEMGTSGFLYRSNKLMYDKATQSLWNTFWGKPVIDPLADKPIELDRLSVITTTCKEWKRRHPNSSVLSLDTGYQRDYSEGAAYKKYFATDELMFSVPELDRRLNNKDEVLGLVFRQQPNQALAISIDYLQEHPLYQDQLGDLNVLILTDRSGANRVYESKQLRFKQWDLDQTLMDESGIRWTLSEDKLVSANGQTLHRLPAQRAFWFGWYSAYSHTRLIRLPHK